MKSYVLIYNRESGQLAHEEYTDNTRAFRRRLDLELQAEPGTEIVVLRARDLSELLATHGRYFRPGIDLTERIAAALG